jgi:hypothetical protein
VLRIGWAMQRLKIEAPMSSMLDFPIILILKRLIAGCGSQRKKKKKKQRNKQEKIINFDPSLHLNRDWYRGFRTGAHLDLKYNGI